MKRVFFIIAVALAIQSGFAVDGLTLGGGVAVGFAKNTEIVEIETQYGFSAYAGFSSYFSLFFDMLFYKPTLIDAVEGLEADGRMTNFTLAVHYPVLSDPTEFGLKIGLGYTMLSETIKLSYLGMTEEASADISGLCIVAVLEASKILADVRYTMFEDSANAQGHLILSAVFKF